MKSVKGLVTLMSAPVKLKNSTIEQNGLSGDVVFSSSDESWLMSGRIDLSPWTMQPPQNEAEMESRPLAVLVQGEFPSYFADKGIPEKPEKEEEAGEEPLIQDVEGAAAGEGTDKTGEKPTVTGIDEIESGGEREEADKLKDFKQEGAIIKRGNPGMVFIMGTAEILKNNVIDEEGSSTNSTFVLNVLDNLNSRDEYAEMRSKIQRFNPLKDTGPGVKAFIKTFNIAGLPVIVVAFGIFVWVRRTTRKKTIQAMFSR